MSACWRFSPPHSKLLPFVLVPFFLVVSGYVSLVGKNTSWPWRFSSAGAGAGDPSVSPSFSPSSVSLSPVSEGQDDRVAVNETTTSEGVPDVEMRGTKEFSAALKLNPVKDITPLPPHVPAEGGNTTKDSEAELSTARVPSSNNSNGSMSELKIKEYTSLERLEAGLRRARLEIRQARDGNRTQDQDYVPNGPMYWNAGAFHRSYLEMEKTFKVFIYDEGEPPVFHSGPCKGIYSTEGNFIHMMEVNRQFRTTDPDRAHAYFLPFSVVMLVQFVYVRDSYNSGLIKQTVADYIDVLSRKYPYWNRSLGFDHFMLSCHDWGPETSRSVPNLYRNSIRVLCNANTSDGFNPSKDVSFPEINLHQTGLMDGLLGGPSPSQRPILAFFAGGFHGPIRPILQQHWENKDDDLKVYTYLPKGMSYYDEMRKSKYCLCPSGYEVASPRVVEAIYTGCVPVLISDHYVPPFSDVLNWRSFSVEVPVGEIPNLKRILVGISSKQYIRMQRRVRSIRRHFEVNSPPKRYDVFHMILHSVWLRRLNVKLG